jgi:cation transport protein ChaC
LSAKPHVLSREGLLSGAVDRLFEKHGGVPGRLTREQLEASLEASFSIAPRGDVWVFAYGSLLWNPVVHFSERRIARLHGYHRRFCLWSAIGRGTPEQPGLMLGLEAGGSCVGAALRVPRAKARDELMLLWRREMIAGSYAPRWLPLQIEGVGGRRRGLVFTMNRTNPRYAGKLPEARVAQAVDKACGPLGTCREYFEHTFDALTELGIADRTLRRLKKRIA